MELSIDTSTRYASVGLSRQGEAIAELSWRSEQNHSVELAPAIRALMGQAGVEVAQVEAVFVAKGPGGFSALRVGMSTAKALAMALKVPLVAVATLDIEALPYLGLGIEVCALLDAGRNQVYMAKYGPELDANTQYRIMGRDALVGAIETLTLFCGEGVLAIADALRASLGDHALIAQAPPPTRRASYLAHLAHRRWQAGAADDPTTLQPLYLRSSQVDTAARKWAS